MYLFVLVFVCLLWYHNNLSNHFQFYQTDFRLLYKIKIKLWPRILDSVKVHEKVTVTPLTRIG